MKPKKLNTNHIIALKRCSTGKSFIIILPAVKNVAPPTPTNILPTTNNNISFDIAQMMLPTAKNSNDNNTKLR